MKPKKDLRKPEKKSELASDGSKMGRKLKPQKKEKNIKRALFQEIDDLEDAELDFNMEDDYDYEEEDEE